MEENELPVESLLREVREETGLSIHVLFAFNTFMIGKGTDRCTVGINYVAALQSSAANIVLSDEHTAFRWSTLLGLRSLAKSIGLQKELDAYESFRKSVAAFGF